LAVSVPIGEPPDEPAHIVRAASLLHGDLFGQRREWKDADGNIITGAGITANPALLDASLGYFPQVGSAVEKKMTLEIFDRLSNMNWSASPKFLYAPNTAVYMPLFYVPAAFALGLAHELQFLPHDAILAGRLTNAVCFALVGLTALLLARRGRGILFVALTLPMTLSLAASFNQDGLLIATSALAAALLTRCVVPRGTCYWMSGVGLACIIAAKIAYLPLAGALLIPAFHSRQSRNSHPTVNVPVLAFATLPGIVWTLVSLVYVASPFVRGPAYHPGPLWPGDPRSVFHTTDAHAQFQVFRHSPSLLFILPMHEWRSDVIWLRLREMVGFLGQLDVLLPQPLYVLWYWAIPSSILACLIEQKDASEMPRAGGAIVGVVSVILSCIAVYDAQYLSWTVVGATDIDGVQGRYALPLLAFLAPAIPGFRVTSWRRMVDVMRSFLLLPAAAAAAIGIAVLPQVILETYYLR
jgi:hypothetical protein